MTSAFLMLSRMYGDPTMAEMFGEERTVAGWLAAEAALAQAQAEVGVLALDVGEAITHAARMENVDRAALWPQARNVGYPILPLVRMIDAALGPEAEGRVHYGATTQDIMDTGLALQLRDAAEHLDELVRAFGDAVAALVDRHRHTVLAARTHAQQAVPTTFGAKLSVLLAELTRHRRRLGELRPRIAVVSLYGAGGTSAALGSQAPAVRRGMAVRLGLGVSDVPWHVARDSVAEFGYVCAGLAATCARFAREVVDLARTEIGEVAEADGHHRGASSTMPQKANPVGSEAVIGMSATASALSAALGRIMEAGHERAAGEWQIEWEVLPELAVLAGGCLREAAVIAGGLRVFPEAMRRNIQGDGYVMAEAQMMRLAGTLGRERAHDLVYEAVREARTSGEPLEDVLLRNATEAERVAIQPIPPEDYVGMPDLACDSALRDWAAADGAVPAAPIPVPDPSARP
ncbi:MAG TPA: adenylosuccinate lyase family protein [Solirubrobacteraceae bacterium]|nr:adenylosuccinate lyase family protein [Solirubrobacteraceae bacterium]